MCVLGDYCGVVGVVVGCVGGLVEVGFVVVVVV